MTLLSHYDGTTFKPANGIVTCTSTTRPSNPRDGMLIYESDTGKAYLRSAGVWVTFSSGGGGGGTSMDDVRAATNTGGGWNLTLSGLQTVDGVSLVAGDRVLVRAQTTETENGIYVVASGAWTRSTDYATIATWPRGSTVRVKEGTNNKFDVLMQTRQDPTSPGPEWRRVADVDMVGAFTFPTPQGTGHMVFNANSKCIAIWDGSAWSNTGIIPYVNVSTAKPNTTFMADGSIMYETDTKEFYVKDGSAGWRPLGGHLEMAGPAPVKAVGGWFSGITLSGLYNVDGYALQAGDRVLCRAQSPQTDNGIYVAAAGAWTRAADYPAIGTWPRGTQILVGNDGASSRYQVFTQTEANPGSTGPRFSILNSIHSAGVYWPPQVVGTGALFHNQHQHTIQINNGSGWENIGQPWVCTSATRPSPVADGAHIYESDTGKYLIYQNSAWHDIGTGGANPTAAVGTISMWATNVAPWGWLICDGSTFSSNDWPALATLLGDTYGAHVGTSYYLPNLKGRVAVGRDAGQTEFDTLAETGGAKTVTLSTAEMPSHQHNVPMDGSTAGYPGGIAPVASFFANNPPSHPGYLSRMADPSGGGAAHNNLQPYQVVNYIIKASPPSVDVAGNAVGAASVNLNFTQSVAFSSAIPGATDGTSFTTPAGVLRGTVNMTAYTTGPAIAVEVYIDGVLADTMRMSGALTANAHMALSTASFNRTVTAGTHYIAFRQTSGNSGSYEYGSFFGVITPATGTLADPITVLNARKTSNQSIGAAWTVVSGWTVLNSYPTWAAESSGAFTIPADGYYEIDCNVMMDNQTIGRSLAVYINGAPVTQVNVSAAAAAGHGSSQVHWEGNLVAGSTMAIYAYHGSTANVLTGPGDGYAAGTFVTKLTIRKTVSGGPGGTITLDGWHVVGQAGEPAFENSFANYAGWTPTSFRKYPDGKVRLRGMVQRAASSGQLTIFTLPLGYRPSGPQIFAAPVGEPNQHGRVDISPDGTVKVLAIPSASGWVTLSTIEFDTESAWQLPGYAVTATIPDTGWIPVTYQNGWSDYPDPWEKGFYRRIGGITWIKGLCRPGTISTTVPIFTLPAGFRPNSDMHIATHGTAKYGALNVYADGRVCPNAGFDAGGYGSLRIQFPADQ